MQIENIGLLIQIMTLLGIIFAIYKYFRTPDEKADKAIALLKVEVTEWKGRSEKQIEINQNCIRSLGKEINDLAGKLSLTNQDIVKLATIIDERIPKKQ